MALEGLNVTNMPNFNPCDKNTHNGAEANQEGMGLEQFKKRINNKITKNVKNNIKFPKKLMEIIGNSTKESIKKFFVTDKTTLDQLIDASQSETVINIL